MMSGSHRRSRTGTRLLFLGALLLGAMLMVSCGGDGPGAPTGATLEQATYLTENSREGTATLEDGEFREPVAEGSAIELVIRLGKWTTGHIDGRDGVDAAAVTVEDSGGSGTFSYLHALVDDDGELSDAAVAFLGDRIRVEGVSIHDGVITVAMFDRAPLEPFAEPPTIAVIRQFRLEAGTLVEQDLSDDAAYTKAFVRQAMNLYVALGLEETVAYYNAKESVDGQWYVFIIDENQTIIAHAPNPDLVGKHVSQALGPNSYPTGSAVAASANQDGAWFDYTYPNPASGVVETKHSWVVIHDGITFGSGWYERGPGKSDAPAYTKALVRQAMNLYVALGLEETVAYYNTQESVDGQWYVFIIGQDGYTIAHHNPQFRGRDPSLRVDATGYFYGDDLLSATEAGHWVDYVLLNPESGENRQKHTWIVRHDGLLFGSGWYE